MEHRPFGTDGAPGLGRRLRLLGGRRRLRRRRGGGVRTRRRAGARPRHQLLRHRRGVRHGRLRARPRAGARPAPRRGDRRHQVRDELPGHAEPSRQQPRARHVLDRQEPQEPRHRLGRRLSRALARPADAVRGDDAGARGRRPRRQGPVRRRLELQARGDRGLHAGAPRRRRPVRLEHVRPAHAARDLPVLPGARHRRHGVRVARLRAADGHLHRGHGLRLGGLARPAGQDGLDQALRRAVRPGVLSRGTSGRWKS